MEISVLALPDVEVSSGLDYIKTQLASMPSLKGLSPKQLEFKATVFKKLQSSDEFIPESFLEQLNKLASIPGIVFIEGFYKFAFNTHTSIQKGNDTKGTYQENVNIGGFILDDITYKANTEAELKALVYAHLVYQQSFNSSQSVGWNIVKPPLVESYPKPLYEHEAFGKGKITDCFSAMNFGVPYKSIQPEDIDTLDQYVPKPPKDFKPLLIEVLNKVKTGTWIPFAHIKNPNLIFEDYVNGLLKRAEQPMEPIKEEPFNHDSVDFFTFVDRVEGIAGNDDARIKFDLYHRTVTLMDGLLGLDKFENKGTIEEITNVILVIIKKLLLKKMNYAKKIKFSNWDNELSFDKTLYIVACIHYLQNERGIKQKDPVNYFITALKHFAKEDLDILGYSDNIIKEYYLKAATEITKLINDENLKVTKKRSVTEYTTPLDRYIHLVERMKSSEPLSVKLKKTHDSKSAMSDPLYLSIIKQQEAEVSNELFVSRPFRYNPVAWNAIIHKVLTDHRMKWDIKTKHDWVFSSFSIDRFYSYYKYGCPKSIYHSFVTDVSKVGKPCEFCKVTQEMIDKKDTEYYEVYKKNFELSLVKSDTKVISVKPTKLTESHRSLTETQLMVKLEDSSIKSGLAMYQLLRLGKHEGKPKMDTKQVGLSEELHITTLHKLQYYLSRITKKEESPLNYSGTLLEQYMDKLMGILEKSNKEALLEIVKRETEYAFVDANELIAKKGLVLEESKKDDTKEFADDDLDLEAVNVEGEALKAGIDVETIDTTNDIDYDGENDGF